MGDRADRIDACVAKAGELIGALQQHGSVTPNQAKLIVEAVVRAEIPNFETWEVRESAKRVATELGREEVARTRGRAIQIDLPLDG
jgi:hypothetical protein